MIAGSGSGCGKTTTVCAILRALVRRGLRPAAFKCGPDYIDPMFHSEIIGARSDNIDLFFTDENAARAQFLRHGGELNLIEGVMGYYDGLSMETDEASAHRVARALDAPVILVVSGRGMALSIAAVVKGFLDFRKDSRIAGVILNQISPMSYPAIKAAVERETGVHVYGYLPKDPAFALESRHLGLVTAGEVENLRAKMDLLSEQAERSFEIDALIELMRAQKPIEAADRPLEKIGDVTIAVARDRAFSFYYRENLELLERFGARLVEFSPLKDADLPACDGLYLGGGYPELHLAELSNNRSLLDALAKAVHRGVPTVAECGGFMLLSRSIGGYEMAGAISSDCFDTKKLSRFGYVTLTAKSDSLLLRTGERVRAHEFHYWDSDQPGGDLRAQKPSGRAWDCAHVSETLYAGYPHLSFASNPETARRFVAKALERKNT